MSLPHFTFSGPCYKQGLSHGEALKDSIEKIGQDIFSDEASEIIFKSFSDILSLISGKYYPPRSKKVIYLINRVKKNKYSKSTLGGCIVEGKDNFISILKEPKIRKMSYQPRK